MVKLDKGSIAQAFVLLTFGHAATRLTSSLQDALRAFGEASLTLVADLNPLCQGSCRTTGVRAPVV